MARLALNLHEARTIVEAKADPNGGRLISATRYLLWGMEAPQEVMAAYERCLARSFGILQSDGDLLVSWAVQTSLMKGDFGLAGDIRDVLEKLGWQPTDT